MGDYSKYAKRGQPRVSPFSREVIFTRARVSLPLLSLRTNGGLLEVYKKRTTSRGITKFSEPFSRKFSFHSTLLPEFLELSVEWFAFSFYGQGGTLWTICFQFILKKKKKKILYFFSAFPCGPLNFSLHGLNTGL